MPGKLYLVATPIGNLQDMTFRAVEVLKNVNLIACEDTRHTRKLLNHYSITNRTISYHEYNEFERADELANHLVNGESIAVVSDAGTPGICDPAYRIVRKAIDVGAEVISIPGPVAFVTGLIASGLATDSIYFGGFLPSKNGDRIKRLEEARDIPATLVYYEAPHRIARSLATCLSVLGDREAAVVRELTKIHEEIVRGRLSELSDRFEGSNPKGEIVLCIDRRDPGAEPVSHAVTLPERTAQLEKEGLDRKAALKKAAREFGISRSEAYRRLLGER